MTGLLMHRQGMEHSKRVLIKQKSILQFARCFCFVKFFIYWLIIDWSDMDEKYVQLHEKWKCTRLKKHWLVVFSLHINNCIWIILLLLCCGGNGNCFNDDCGCGNNGCGCGMDNSCIWIILLLLCCGGNFGGNGCGCGNDGCC